MHAVDTNVVVRYLTGDDPKQSLRAKAFIDGSSVFVPTTVVLETEWVLRTLYHRSAAEIAAALRTLAGQPTVTLEQPMLVSTALEWNEAGVDLADALHLASSHHCEGFATFDRSLAKAAKRVTDLLITEP
jgi:predicted nucleic-acid-binding protein